MLLSCHERFAFAAAAAAAAICAVGAEVECSTQDGCTPLNHGKNAPSSAHAAATQQLPLQSQASEVCNVQTSVSGLLRSNALQGLQRV
jgi:hypothetical protein